MWFPSWLTSQNFTLSSPRMSYKKRNRNRQRDLSWRLCLQNRIVDLNWANSIDSTPSKHHVGILSKRQHKSKSRGCHLLESKSRQTIKLQIMSSHLRVAIQDRTCWITKSLLSQREIGHHQCKASRRLELTGASTHMWKVKLILVSRRKFRHLQHRESHSQSALFRIWTRERQRKM